ncbi:hypothetical protein [Gemmatimonas sp.]|uniref:hypothetical protein n=1 Tax=Gemmatimonas sp. TaxID=1962908 RepID=UPI003DA35EDF
MTDPVPAVTDELSVETVETPVAPAPAVHDRADNPVTEVAERFLRAVVASVPLDQIEELHLFSPLRQGTVETGIAVLAARVPVAVVEPVAEEPVVSDEPELGLDENTADDADENDATDDDAVDEALDDDESLTVVLDDSDRVSPYALEAELTADVAAAPAEVSAEESDEAEAIIEPPAPKERPVRHTVYTARYRYVIKGPERGKWESNVKAEAEAPLITVETVVRGVQRRAGEDSEIVRYSAAQIARALRLPYPG